MSILITCVGGSDPIRGEHDGPILHILRNYKEIEKCYLFFSKKTYELHQIKNYYMLAFEDYMKKNNHSVEFKEIKMDEIEKPNDFDAYYNIFYNNINNIINENKGEKILFNLTSGTPQMQTTLAVVVSQLEYYNCESIQVDNYDFDSKAKTCDAFSNDYDIELQIMFNTDNDINRSHKVYLYNIIRNNKISQIKTLINKYEYKTIIDFYEKYLSNRNIKLLKFLNYRKNMEYDSAYNLLKYEKLETKKYFPVCSKNPNSLKNKIFEYYLLLNILLNNQLYNDFTIRIDSYTVEIQIEFLKKFFNLDINKYINKKFKFNIEKLEEDNKDLSDYIISEYFNIKKSEYESSNVNIQLLNIILKYYFDNEKFEEYDSNKLLDFFDKLNILHKKRNHAAHTLSIILKSDIETIISINLIKKMFKEIIMLIYPDINEKYFDSYELINEELLNNLI